MLTTFLMPVTLLSPQAIGTRNIRVREFIVAMLVLETGMIGAFVALDLFVFYVFWELMLIPMYFIIGIWGGERRLYAAIKFVIYTLVGSLLMLVAILYLYVAVQGGDRHLQLRLHAAVAPDAAVRAAAGLLRRVRARVRDQGADVPAAHLAARRARRGADRRLGDPGRRAAEVRHLRLPALRAADVPAGGRGGGAADRRAGGDRHHVRRADGVRAGRRQEAGRVFVGVAPRLRRARHPDAERAGRAGGDLPDARPRHRHRRAVPRRRPALRPPPHAPAGGLRRPVEADADLRGLLPGHRAGARSGCPGCAASSASSWC